MSRLNAALLIGAALMLAGAGDAQAAKIRFPRWDFGLIDGLGTPPDLVLNPSHRIPAIDLDGDDSGNGGDGNGIKPQIKPDNSRSQWTAQYADSGEWTSQYADNPDSGEWQHTTTSQDTPQWTMQTATRDDP